MQYKVNLYQLKTIARVKFSIKIFNSLAVLA
jgi:hypothetical protein